MYSGRPQPEQTVCVFSAGRRQVGQRYPKGVPLPQAGQNRASGSMQLPQWMQGYL